MNSPFKTKAWQRNASFFQLVRVTTLKYGSLQRALHQLHVQPGLHRQGAEGESFPSASSAPPAPGGSLQADHLQPRTVWHLR